MRYLSVTEIAKKWDVSERSVRNYCAQGRVNGAFLTGKTWNIPENVEKPERSNKKKEQPITLLDILQEQKASKYSGGIYHKTQIDLTYNSNHIEGNRLTHDQTRYIFETNTIGVEKDVLNVDVFIESVYASFPEAAGQYVLRAASIGAVQPRYGSVGTAGRSFFHIAFCPRGVYQTACYVRRVRGGKCQSVFPHFRFG